MSGYELPGVTLTDVTDIKTAILSSTQRIPCFIGTASNQKTVVNEQVTRSTSGLVDQLVNYTTGITSVVKAGSQKGLSDIKENVDFSLNYNTGEITWLTNSESRSISSGVYGLELFKSLTTFAAFATATKGTDATSGKQGFGLDIIATADSGLALNTTYTFRVNTVDHSITTPSFGSFVSVATVAELVNTALASTQFTAEFSISDIYIINSVTGSSSTVTLAEGDSGNNLFSSLTGWSAFKTAVTGAVATSGKQSLGLTVVGTDNTGLAASTRYYFKINGVTVGIATGGDTQAIVKQNCLFFQQNNCDVAFSAIRTKGKTCQDLDAFAKQYGLTVNKQSQNIVNDITKQYASNLAKAQELYNLI